MYRSRYFVRRPAYQAGRRYLSLDDWDYDFDKHKSFKLIEYKPHDDLYITNNYGSDVLTVKNVNLNKVKNMTDHKTNMFIMDDTDNFIIRRGIPFQISISFGRAFDKNKHDLRFVFEFGKNTNPTKGTKVSIKMSDVDKPQKWGAYIDKHSGNNMTVTITTPPNCFVGRWTLKVETIKKNDENKDVFQYKHEENFVVLFNPWCKDDTVYMKDEVYLNEYVLNETGVIYVGNKNRISPRKWNFGQFQEDILDCVLYLLDEKSGMAETARGDPVKTVRKISSLANSSDNNGVLTGRWDGNYAGGTSPVKWCGSVRILQSYYRNKYPVRYGQCWVFSGVVTTLCRALGIPTRSVTNFCSAHDTDGSLAIEKCWNDEGDPLENSDSVWNFHVWNDVWMARPDLCPEFGGWQAIDATPQEASDGVYCCGPYPLAAIKEGRVNEQYDGRFIFAEVNADITNNIIKEDGTVVKFSTEKHNVGQFISTKIPKGRPLPGPTKNCTDGRRADITDEYKFPEGSKQERQAVKTANLECIGADSDDEDDKTVKDVEFTLDEREVLYIGQDYEVVLRIKNNSNETRTIKGVISSSSCYYTGFKYATISRIRIDNLKVKAHEVLTKKMSVTYEDYQFKVVDNNDFKISCKCTVEETGQIYQDQDDFKLITPEIDVTVPREVKAGQRFIAKLSFENPLKTSLMRCKFECEGPPILKHVQFPVKSIEPKGKVYEEVELIAAKTAMTEELIVAFSSNELDDVTGSCEVVVKP